MTTACCVLQSYEVNSRGLEIFSKSWLPETSRPKAIVCYCHGYGDTCTFFFEGMLVGQKISRPNLYIHSHIHVYSYVCVYMHMYTYINFVCEAIWNLIIS